MPDSDPLSCYSLPVLVDPSLSKCINESHAHLQEQLGPDYTLLDLRYSDKLADGKEASAGESAQISREQLHISLTRPFTVRSYERDEYVKVASAEVQKLKATVGR